jgi:hypothetical protein
MDAWRETASTNQLNEAQVYQLSISPQGLIVDHK